MTRVRQLRRRQSGLLSGAEARVRKEGCERLPRESRPGLAPAPLTTSRTPSHLSALHHSRQERGPACPSAPLGCRPRQEPLGPRGRRERREQTEARGRPTRLGLEGQKGRGTGRYQRALCVCSARLTARPWSQAWGRAARSVQPGQPWASASVPPSPTPRKQESCPSAQPQLLSGCPGPPRPQPSPQAG